MDNNQGSFFDKNTLLAVGLTIIVWVGWSKYMQNKYPNAGKAVVQDAIKAEEAKSVAATSTGVNSGDIKTDSTAEIKEVAAPAKKEYPKLSFYFENVSFDVVSKGMGLSNIRLNNFTDRKDELIQISSSSNEYPNFSTKFKGSKEDLFFELKKISETEVLGTYSGNGIVVEKKYAINPKNYSITSSVNVKADGTLPNIQTVISERAEAPAETSLLNPAVEKQEVVVTHKEGSEREVFDKEEPYIGEFNSSFLVSLTSHYFASAVIDKSEAIPNFESNYDKNKETALAYLTYPSFAGTSELNLNYQMFFGPKDIEVLQSVNPGLSDIVDLGWFGFISEPLLGLLKWLYSILGNWGYAIIALTILVRLVVMPFNIMSYSSMKKMQEIQPTLKAIREKHKDDQVRMNQEVMGVMSQNKVNPMGGCLPMLLQFPIFIALYRVLSASVDLYKAPFGLWITDLSLKDPYFVLPILMGVSMFVQQKITPNTMDPAQQKVMMIMPVMFSFLMISLPSGLTLYIFISTLFGIIQQQLFMNKKTA